MAATLPRFCLFVIASIRAANKATGSIIDGPTSVCSLTLTGACIFLFLAIRSTSDRKSPWYETIAGYLFIVSLPGMMAIICLIT